MTLVPIAWLVALRARSKVVESVGRRAARFAPWESLAADPDGHTEDDPDEHRGRGE